MARVLSQAERVLWRRVTADVRTSRLIIADEVEMENAVLVSAPSRPMPTPSTPVVAPQPRPHVAATQLDASWEKRLRAGLAAPDRVVDLHGLTAAEAHRRAIGAIEAGWANGARLILLITGKAPPHGSTRLDQPLRGIIRASLADWIAASPVRGHVAAVRAAHRKHGGEGAVYVILRRVRPGSVSG